MCKTLLRGQKRIKIASNYNEEAYNKTHVEVRLSRSGASKFKELDLLSNAFKFTGQVMKY